MIDVYRSYMNYWDEFKHVPLGPRDTICDCCGASFTQTPEYGDSWGNSENKGIILSTDPIEEKYPTAIYDTVEIAPGEFLYVRIVPEFTEEDKQHPARNHYEDECDEDF